MITKENITIIDNVSDGYREFIIGEFKKLKNYKLKNLIISICVFIFTIIALLCIVYGGFFSRLSYIFLYDRKKTILFFMIYLSFSIFIMYLVYRVLIRINRNMGIRYDMEHGGIEEKLFDYYTTRSIYLDLKSGKMGLINLTDSKIRVKCSENDKEKEFDIPVKYSVIQSDNNEIRFFNDYIELYLTEYYINEMTR